MLNKGIYISYGLQAGVKKLNESSNKNLIFTKIIISWGWFVKSVEATLLKYPQIANLRIDSVTRSLYFSLSPYAYIHPIFE